MPPRNLGFGSGVTCWRWLAAWQATRARGRLQTELLTRLGEADRIDWSRCFLKRGKRAGQKWGEATGLSPIERGKRGRRRRRPGKRHADKGHDHAFCRRECREWRITPRFARRGVEASWRPGRCRPPGPLAPGPCGNGSAGGRSVVECTSACTRFRRLVVRYDRRADLHLALNNFAALIC